MDLLTKLLSKVCNVHQPAVKAPSPAGTNDAPIQSPEVTAVDPTDFPSPAVNLAMFASSQPIRLQSVRQTVPSMLQPSPLPISKQWMQTQGGLSKSAMQPAVIAPDEDADNPASNGSAPTRFLRGALVPDFQSGPFSKSYGGTYGGKI